MLIEDLRVESSPGVRSFVAKTFWENRKKPAFDIRYAVEERDAWRASINPDAFRIPAAVVAMHDGEDRLSDFGSICPVLHQGLTSSLQWLARWSEKDLVPPTIDIPIGCSHPSGEGDGSAMFLSGGVDSMALLASNQVEHPPGDPLRFSVGFVIVGIQKHRWTDSDSVRSRLRAARDDLDDVAKHTGIDIVPVATNLRALVGSSSFWKYEYQGAVLVGTGQLFASSIANLSIASTWKISHLDKWGSHPLVDLGYGTHSLRVWHELVHLGRLEKTDVIAKRPELLRALSVCNERAGGNGNCGECEKCLRTMLAFEALQIDMVDVFGKSRVEPEVLRPIRIGNRGLEGDYEELVRPLVAVGRADLAQMVQRQIDRSRMMRWRGVKATRRVTRRLRSKVRER